jgi:hypothetical protein
MYAIEPVFAGARPGAAADRFKIDLEVPIVRVDTGEARRRARPLPAAMHRSGAACANAPITKSAAR